MSDEINFSRVLDKKLEALQVMQNDPSYINKIGFCHIQNGDHKNETGNLCKGDILIHFHCKSFPLVACNSYKDIDQGDSPDRKGAYYDYVLKLRLDKDEAISFKNCLDQYIKHFYSNDDSVINFDEKRGKK
ncbi:MAG TPA: hypothetical protein VNU45_00320 [Rummeliibacillus sp.]|nr:hypothetical protein [Rummeliibacillus sp.]